MRKEADGGLQPNPAIQAIAWTMIIRPLIYTFLFVMVMSMLAWPYSYLRNGAK